MSALFGLPFAALGPQLALTAGVLVTLLAGTLPGIKAQFLRMLAVSVLLAALAFLGLGVPGMSGPLLRLDGISFAWQALFYAGALPLAFAVREEDEAGVALFLASALGMGLLAGSANLLMLFIALEFMSLPAYLLVARGEPRRSALEAAVKYFFAGGTAGALFLMGMSLYYAAGKGFALAPVPGELAQAGLALMGTAALFKIGAVPLHFWLPDAYEASRPPVAGFLSTSMKAAGVLLLIRLVALDPRSSLAALLPAIGALTMLAGAVLALRQRRLQRLLAYSSIAHAGNLILGVGAWAARGAEPGGLVPVLFYLGAYLFMSNGAFAFLDAARVTSRDELRGLASREPVLAGIFAMLLLALGGIPPTAGFLAKLLIFWDALKAGLYAPVAAAALAALIALAYYLALIRDMYFEAPGGPLAAEARPDRTVLWACAVPAAVLGLAPWALNALAGVLRL